MKIALLFAGLAGVLAGVPEILAAPRSDAELARYHVVWDSPSSNAHGSMPTCPGQTNLSTGLRNAAEPVWLPATPEKLPRWRGFNLLEKFQRANQQAFVEKDFQLIRELGFNFVRLPMDYRCWIVGDDWEKFNEARLKEIDQAVEWGRQYGLHVSLNFHRAPGYTVASPPEAKSLWTDPEAQRVCALHWAVFARRYQGIPSERLSFNLMNEPSNVELKVHDQVVRQLVAAIRRADPDRLIIADGLEWGTVPIPSLADLKIAQATRGYAPFTISHYQASWVNSGGFPEPAWPRAAAYGFLCAPAKQEWHGPLIMDGPFAGETRLRLRVGRVSSQTRLVVAADGRPIFDKEFKPGPGAGEWKEAEFKKEWNIYQNLFDRDYAATVPAGTKQVTLTTTEGDWLEVREIGLTVANAPERKLALDAAYGKQPRPIRYFADGRERWFQTAIMEDRAWLKQTMMEPWLAVQPKGVGVMVGEFGAYNRTPHDVTLRWLEDSLANWQAAGWGWALWNFRGSFGILDSGRADVPYEAFQGHKLDRRMLELLQRY